MYRRKISKSTRKRSPRLLLVILIGAVALAWFFPKFEKNPLAFLQQAGMQSAFASEANQSIDQQSQAYPTAPLILQTDERWADHKYGFGEGENTIGMNGCALASLAMVLSYWENRIVEPTEILNWSQNHYYVAGAGTSWTIFEDFGHQFQLNVINLGNDMATAESYLRQGIPVIVSVTPGEFTNNGHIMVLRDWNDSGISVNDPNDNQQKKHFQQNYDPTEIANQVINYWVYVK